MKKIGFRKLLSLILAALCLALAPVANALNSDTGELITDIIDRNSEGSVSEWIKNGLSKSPQSTEWYAIGISKAYPNESLIEYAEALEDYLSKNTVYSATTRQKYGLTLIACGRGDSDYLNGLVDDTAGKQGIMSYVFALHLVTNGAKSDTYRPETLIPILLKLACPNGGWSLTGKTADPDVTAMTVQALAPYYNVYTEVKTAVDAAITVLSEMQQADGGYSSFGAANPESAAQVIIALRSVGIEPLTDTRFIKNQNDLLNGITRYKLPDGGYKHTENGNANAAAEAQAFLAFICLEEQDASPFFVFLDTLPEYAPLDSTLSDSLITPPTTDTPPSDNESDNPASGGNGSDTIKGSDKKTGGYKLPVCIGIAIATAAACLILFILKKRSSKNYLLVAVIGAVLIVAVVLTNFSSPDEYYGNEITKDAPIGAVSIEIKCDPSVNNGGNAVILEKTSIQIEEGETVYDILSQITKQNGIKLDAAGSVTGSMYVRGIGELYEFDHGDLSGWIYMVNGERIMVDCDSYTLKDGDSIVWEYTLSLTE